MNSLRSLNLLLRNVLNMVDKLDLKIVVALSKGNGYSYTKLSKEPGILQITETKDLV